MLSWGNLAVLVVSAWLSGFVIGVGFSAWVNERWALKFPKKAIRVIEQRRAVEDLKRVHKEELQRLNI